MYFIGWSVFVYRGKFQTRVEYFQPFYYAQVILVLIYASMKNNVSDPMFLICKAIWTSSAILNITFYQYVNQAGAY